MCLISPVRLKQRSDYPAFTLMELLVVISIISVILTILMPVLAGIRRQARAVCCMSNLRQLGLAFACYASDNRNYVLPARTSKPDTYWWGRCEPNGIDHTEGPLWPYMQSDLQANGVYQCPSQPIGSYSMQGKPAGRGDSEKWITSTYGYNGYYLSAPQSGWLQTKDRPWQKLFTIPRPHQVIVFADAMLDWAPDPGQTELTNIALLDPPYLLSNNRQYWTKNDFPTTCFRHDDKANAVFVDGHCRPMGLEGSEYTSPEAKIGSVGKSNAPYYVPDYKDWPAKKRRGIFRNR